MAIQMFFVSFCSSINVSFTYLVVSTLSVMFFKKAYPADPCLKSPLSNICLHTVYILRDISGP